MPYFVEPFANSGIVAPIPELAAPDGSVSYEMGFTELYERDLATDPSALPVPMDQFNQLMNDITVSIQEYQKFAFPKFITSDDNLGTPFDYVQGNRVYFAGTYYQCVNETFLSPTDDPYSWALDIWGYGDGALGYDSPTSTIPPGSAVYFKADGTGYGLAIADGSVAQNVVGFKHLEGPPYLIEAFGTCVISSSSVLTLGQTYYLSASTPGAITINPTNVKVGVASSNNSLLVNIVNIASVGGFVTGDQKTTYNPNAEAGWILKRNGTIGSAASGATILADASTIYLYTLLWNSTTNTNCPVSGGRGVSAAADFSANKTIALPVCNGTVDVNIGTSSYELGQAFGASTVALTAANNGPHDHGLTSITLQEGGPNTPSLATDVGTGPGFSGLSDSSGSGTPFSIQPPSTGVWMKIKL